MANSTLRQYAGDRQRGSTVTEFIEYVRVLNTNDTFPQDITLTFKDGSTTKKVAGPNSGDNNAYTITNNAYYDVELTDTDSDGYYDKGTIE